MLSRLRQKVFIHFQIKLVECFNQLSSTCDKLYYDLIHIIFAVNGDRESWYDFVVLPPEERGLFEHRAGVEKLRAHDLSPGNGFARFLEHCDRTSHIADLSDTILHELGKYCIKCLLSLSTEKTQMGVTVKETRDSILT